MSEKVQVVLYTKPGCGLCEEMKEAMQHAGLGDLYTLQEVNIEQDAELYARYRYDIPVLCIDRVEAFRHRLDPEDFRNYLASLLAANWRLGTD